MKFTREDGSKGEFVVFAGWSRFSELDRYLMTDLVPLRDHVRKVLKDWSNDLY